MSKLQFQFDKKQMPQILSLAVLSVGMLSYFTWKVLTPPPPERASAAVNTVVLTKTTAVMPLSPTDAAMVDLTNGAAPSATMQDPFIPAYVLPPANAIPSIRNSSLLSPQIGSMPAVPYSNLIKPLAGLAPGTSVAATSPPVVSWTVTGVIDGESGRKRIAILRDGEERRFVLLGSMVDDQYRLIGIDRYGVTLTLGKRRIRLILGGDLPKPVAPSLAGFPAQLSSGTPGISTQAISAIAGTSSPAAPAVASPTVGDLAMPTTTN